MPRPRILPLRRSTPGKPVFTALTQAAEERADDPAGKIMKALLIASEIGWPRKPTRKSNEDDTENFLSWGEQKPLLQEVRKILSNLPLKETQQRTILRVLAQMKEVQPCGSKERDSLEALKESLKRQVSAWNEERHRWQGLLNKVHLPYVPPISAAVKVALETNAQHAMYALSRNVEQLHEAQRLVRQAQRQSIPSGPDNMPRRAIQAIMRTLQGTGLTRMKAAKVCHDILAAWVSKELRPESSKSIEKASFAYLPDWKA